MLQVWFQTLANAVVCLSVSLPVCVCVCVCVSVCLSDRPFCTMCFKAGSFVKCSADTYSHHTPHCVSLQWGAGTHCTALSFFLAPALSLSPLFLSAFYLNYSYTYLDIVDQSREVLLKYYSAITRTRTTHAHAHALEMI